MSQASGAITGTPTKPGHYTATITVTSGVNGKKKVESSVDFDIGNYTDDLIKVSDSYGDYCVGVMVQEPIAAAVTIVAAGAVVPVMPYLLAFAAGAMMYVVVEELIPEMSEGEHSNWGTIAFSLGFVLMMILDVTLG